MRFSFAERGARSGETRFLCWSSSYVQTGDRHKKRSSGFAERTGWVWSARPPRMKPRGGTPGARGPRRTQTGGASAGPLVSTLDCGRSGLPLLDLSISGNSDAGIFSKKIYLRFLRRQQEIKKERRSAPGCLYASHAGILFFVGPWQDD